MFIMAFIVSAVQSANKTIVVLFFSITISLHNIYHTENVSRLKAALMWTKTKC